MEERKNLDSMFDGTYKLIQDDFNVDDQPQEEQQDVKIVLTSGSSLKKDKHLAVSLMLLAALLLAVDIGLGVFYNKLTQRQRSLMHYNAELTKLQETYDEAMQSRDEALKQLAAERSQQQVIKWALEHQERRNKNYQKQTDQIQTDIASLQSHIPLFYDGCRHCLPGWIFMNSMCYYFSTSEAVPRRTWQAARDYCKRQGGDLAVIDSPAKQGFIVSYLRSKQGPFRRFDGFWFGLRDVYEEGLWKWIDGTPVTEEYWNDGEPNNVNNEDCATVLMKENFFKAWNDLSCEQMRRWICEMNAKGL
ncbi:CD209 antigen-like protein A [Thalassophryne amazonica]|uniref:CD209 antigen-like protein A n=1 Tax=Thalassophryne amazonica TaxID=390379 RepID=UPI0014721103|nr:CD209 antigen-like protein A [Thalassophryne amazonica]